MSKMKSHPFTLTLRLDEEVGRKFAALVSLNGTSATEVLRNFINDYVENHKDAAAKKLTE
jgi:predicted DNA-binding protein